MITPKDRETPIVLWHDLVSESLEKTGLHFSDAVSHYLVLTLDAYTKKINLSSVVLATEFLKNINVNTTSNSHALRDVGDQCLILSGLFPDRSIKKRVTTSYFSDLGKHAYYVLSFANTPWKSNQNLFYQLFDNFSDLTQVLQTMRELNQRALH